MFGGGNPADKLSIRKKGVAEGSNGEYDDEAGMAETNLHTIARAAKGLLDTIDDNENLPEWVQEKIAKVEGMMTSAWDYLESQEDQGVDPRVDEGILGSDPNRGQKVPYWAKRGIVGKIGRKLDPDWSDVQRTVPQNLLSKQSSVPTTSATTTQSTKGMQKAPAGAPTRSIPQSGGVRPSQSTTSPSVTKNVAKKIADKQGVAGSQLEETYHDDDEFFEAYGVMEYNDEMINEAEYQGRKVTLNKPVRSSGGPKKFHVFVKNGKGNIIKVNFGDPKSKIKKHIPGRRANFRARHNCDTAKDKTTARYWSCRNW
jgi:hypothetical protein